MEYLDCVDASHFSVDFMTSLKALLGHSHVLSCMERRISTGGYNFREADRSVFYEVRINTVEPDGHWYHRCLTETNHYAWQWQKQRLHKKDIFPSALAGFTSTQNAGGTGPLLIFSGIPDHKYVHVKLFNLAYAGWVPNVRAEYFNEIAAWQRLSQLNFPAVGKYLGCVVENGLIVGVAVKRYRNSLERAISKDIPCSHMRSGNLVATVSLMQRMGMVRGPIHPSSIMLDSSNCMFLVGVECMFPYDWRGGTKPSYNIRHKDKCTAEVAKSHPLGLVFAKICSQVQSVSREKQPCIPKPKALAKAVARWLHRPQSPIAVIKCSRSVCDSSLSGKTTEKSSGPRNPHILWVTRDD